MSRAVRKDKLFRKAALERLSSPEQLDQVMEITTPRGWLALVAVGALLVIAGLWSVVGRVPTRIAGQGMLIQAGGLFDVVSLGSGQLSDVYVGVGERVQRGQLVALVAQPELVEQRAKARARLADLQDQLQRTEEQGAEAREIKSQARAQKRADLERSMAALADRRRWLEEKLKSQEQLVAKGLLTRQTVVQTRDQITSNRLEAEGLETRFRELDVEALDVESRTEREATASRALVKEAERELELLEQRISLSTRILSAHAGRVVEVRSEVGSLIGPGTPIVNLEIEGERGRELRAVLYVPPALGKSVQPGMLVELAPSTVKREEHGYLVGVVSWVADYPASRRGMMSVLENEQLVETFLRASGGAPIPVYAELRLDPTTPSGYAWSTATGPATRIFSGTLVSGHITIREQRPLSLVFPILREYLGV